MIAQREYAPTLGLPEFSDTDSIDVETIFRECVALEDSARANMRVLTSLRRWTYERR
jgi:hypothetical protein